MDKRSLAWMSAIVVLAVCAYLLSPILTPFIAAFLFAYISNPLVCWIEGKGPSRTISVLIGFGALILVTALIALTLWPIVYDQFARLMENAPEYIDRMHSWVQSNIGLVATNAEPDVQAQDKLVETAKKVLPENGEAVAKTVGAITQSGVMLLAGIVNLFLIPIIAFYLLRDWQRMSNGFNELLPPSNRRLIMDLTTQVNQVLYAFMKGQGLVMLCLGVMYSVGLMLIGLQYGLIIGVIAGLLSFVPYLGTGVGMLIASITFFMQTGELIDLWLIAVVFGVGQFVEGNILTPKLVGDQIDLHPVVVIFAVLAGGQLFGFVGILLALPLAAVIWVVAKRLREDFKTRDLGRTEEHA